MWIEPSINNISSGISQNFEVNEPSPAIITEIEKGSIGEELGFEKGDQLISINGIKPRDLIDYQYLIAEENINISVKGKDNQYYSLDIEKDLDEGLGLVFSEALFDGLKQCNNNCPFCFIDQQPEGRRNTLYLKDDDYRMSFLFGSYLTLTNLLTSDWERIKTQRLSPLFVSVHATDPEIRIKLLQNKRARKIMEQIEWFSKNSLQIHTQIVVCPGINDGKILIKTLKDLFEYGRGPEKTVISAAVVPVGLTKFRPDNDGLKPIDKSFATEVIHCVEKMQDEFQLTIQSRFAWLSDEWYLIAQKPLPSREVYEDLPQQENGVGSIRAFLEAMDLATSNLPKAIKRRRHCSWVVGKIVEDALKPICERLNNIDHLSINLFGLTSPYWGQENVVTGLLTGEDLINGLQNQNLGSELLVPSIMLKQGEDVFLDDMTVEEVSTTLDISIRIVDGPSDIVNAAINSKAEMI